MLLLGMAAEVQALPQDPSIVRGDVDIQTKTTSEGTKQLDIWLKSQVASIDWQKFDIAVGEHVLVRGPSPQSLVINRVVGNTASQIDGHLNANCQFWLINPNGVLFGQDTQVSVGSMLVSTLNTSDPMGDPSVYERGRSYIPYVNQSTYLFTGDSSYNSTRSVGTIINQGNIGAGGAVVASHDNYIVFIANRINNLGTIRAAKTIALVAGSSVTVNFPLISPVSIQVNSGNTLSTSVVQNASSGSINSPQGQVLLYAGSPSSIFASAVNNAGTIEAKSIDELRGQIYLVSGDKSGKTIVTGVLSTSQINYGPGGRIVISGRNVQVNWRNIYAQGYDRAEEYMDSEFEEIENMSASEQYFSGHDSAYQIPIEQDLVSVYASGNYDDLGSANNGLKRSTSVVSRDVQKKWNHIYELSKSSYYKDNYNFNYGPAPYYRNGH